MLDGHTLSLNGKSVIKLLKEVQDEITKGEKTLEEIAVMFEVSVSFVELASECIESQNQTLQEMGIGDDYGLDLSLLGGLDGNSYADHLDIEIPDVPPIPNAGIVRIR